MLTASDSKLGIAAFGKHNLESASRTPHPQIIKKETESPAPMFNLSSCKLFER